MIRAGFVAVALLALATPSAAWAHGRTASYSEWSVRADGASVRVRISARDYNALGAAGLDSDRAVSEALGLDGCTAVADTVRRLPDESAWIRYAWDVRCPARPARIYSDLLFDVVPAHVHFATVTGVGREVVLTPSARAAALPTTGQPARLWPYVRLGVEHIVGGADHLVFLLVVVLLAGSVREVALATGGFTIGHSVTLALASLGYASPNLAAVEALIGLSIALVAIENVWLSERTRDPALPIGAVLVCLALAALGGAVPAVALVGIALFAACSYGLVGTSAHPMRLRAAIAALFGLLHGFGFAGALPTADGMATALLGFNVGVELGQLAVLALAWPVIAFARRGSEQRRLGVVRAGSATALAAGLFWYVTRAFG